MIGKFDQESIEEHENKFKKGQLAMRDVKVAKKELMFSEIDCQKLFLEEQVPDADDYGDEILAEILEEERARKAAQEEEEGGNTNGCLHA